MWGTLKFLTLPQDIFQRKHKSQQQQKTPDRLASEHHGYFEICIYLSPIPVKRAVSWTSPHLGLNLGSTDVQMLNFCQARLNPFQSILRFGQIMVHINAPAWLCVVNSQYFDPKSMYFDPMSMYFDLTHLICVHSDWLLTAGILRREGIFTSLINTLRAQIYPPDCLSNFLKKLGSGLSP